MKKIIIILGIIYLVFEVLSDYYFLTKKIEEKKVVTKPVKEAVVVSISPATQQTQQIIEYKEEKEIVSELSLDELLKKEHGVLSEEKKGLFAYKRKEEKDVSVGLQSTEEYKKTDELLASTKLAQTISKKYISSKDMGEMVLIGAGEFIFGSNDGLENEKPARRIHLKKFYIDKYEVTNRKYKEFTDATGYKPPVHWSGNNPPADKLDHPVTDVSYEDAVAYANWCGKRLPTEQEWEKAAKGPGNRLYPWGDVFDKKRANVIRRFGRRGTIPAGSFQEGISFYGCYDLAGNVWEWTSSDYQRLKIIRGGSFAKSSFCARTTTREIMNAEEFASDVGFRCVKDKHE